MDYPIFDADNHYYEAVDTFTRHGDEKVRKHVRWMSEGKKQHLFFGDRRSTGVPNPTFNPIARPGAFHDRLKLLEKGNRPRPGMQAAYGELEPLPPEYQDRDHRLAVMDHQNVESVWMFPTLGQCVEHLMHDDVDMMYRVFRAFNDWLDEDWGFNYENRIYSPPIIPLLDVAEGVTELERVLDKGAKLICLRPGPWYGRSPADPYFDPFWARVNEAGIFVTYHAIGGQSPYDDMFDDHWRRPGSSDKTYDGTLRQALFAPERPIMDTITALILGDFFGRFPNIQIGSIEMGCSWVPYLMHSLDHAGGFLERRVEAFGKVVEDKPSAIFKERVFVSPFPEEDVIALVDQIGADRVLMGSDWPHPEGNVQPEDYVKAIETLPDDQIRLIMRDNARKLVGAG
ncbi:MAG: amidohydrolase family protein [Actinomycetota bacterium]|nr:amidohydrolase family protein [Actinomycetota bacterium]